MFLGPQKQFLGPRIPRTGKHVASSESVLPWLTIDAVRKFVVPRRVEIFSYDVHIKMQSAIRSRCKMQYSSTQESSTKYYIVLPLPTSS